MESATWPGHSTRTLPLVRRVVAVALLAFEHLPPFCVLNGGACYAIRVAFAAGNCCVWWYCGRPLWFFVFVVVDAIVLG